MPTLVVNNRQYRGINSTGTITNLHSLCMILTLKRNTGKLERKAVLKAICAGFEETTEPNVCLSDGKNK